MTKRIFRSIMLVSAVCMVTGLAFLMGVLYHFFGNQLEKELKAEALIWKGAANYEEALEIINKVRNRARLEDCEIFTPATCPCRLSTTDVAPLAEIVSDFTLPTEPVRSDFFTTP